MLSDFVYSFFEHNIRIRNDISIDVVNCFQILYIRSLNTIVANIVLLHLCCELLSDFVYSFFEHNPPRREEGGHPVVNCFQILYIRSLNTMYYERKAMGKCCELLSDFVYSFFEHNAIDWKHIVALVVNCFQILYIRSLNTIDGHRIPAMALL